MSNSRARDVDVDDDIYDDSDDAEDQASNERAEAMKKQIAEMTDEERERFYLFRDSKNCKLPQAKILEMMKSAVPSSVTIQSDAAWIGTSAAKLFIADLVETARSLSGNKDPLTPDLIMLAYNEIDHAGKLPGKVAGVKRPSLR